jgi:hypothetical protein
MTTQGIEFALDSLGEVSPETSVRLLSETDVSTSSDHDAATTNAGCDV